MCVPAILLNSKAGLTDNGEQNRGTMAANFMGGPRIKVGSRKVNRSGSVRFTAGQSL